MISPIPGSISPPVVRLRRGNARTPAALVFVRSAFASAPDRTKNKRLFSPTAIAFSALPKSVRTFVALVPGGRYGSCESDRIS